MKPTTGSPMEPCETSTSPRTSRACCSRKRFSTSVGMSMESTRLARLQPIPPADSPIRSFQEPFSLAFHRRRTIRRGGKRAAANRSSRLGRTVRMAEGKRPDGAGRVVVGPRPAGRGDRGARGGRGTLQSRTSPLGPFRGDPPPGIASPKRRGGRPSLATCSARPRPCCVISVFGARRDLCGLLSATPGCVRMVRRSRLRTRPAELLRVAAAAAGPRGRFFAGAPCPVRPLASRVVSDDDEVVVP